MGVAVGMRARRPRSCDSAGVEPCRGQGDRGLRAGLPPSAHALSRAIPSLPRSNEGFSFSPSLRPFPLAGRGLPLQPASLLWHVRADPARVHMSRIHMHVSRRKQLPAGSGVQARGGPRPLCGFPYLPCLPPSIPARVPAVPAAIVGCGAGPAPGALLRGRKSFSSAHGDAHWGWGLTAEGSLCEVPRQSRGIVKAGRMLWAPWDCTAENFSRGIFCIPEKPHSRDRDTVNPGTAASISPEPENPRNSRLYFR